MGRKRMERRIDLKSLAGGLALAGLVAGCANSEERTARPLTAEQFHGRGTSLPPDGGRLTGSPVDQAGAIRYDGTGRPAEPGPSADPIATPQKINPTVDQAVRSPYQSDGNAAAAIGSGPPSTSRVDLDDRNTIGVPPVGVPPVGNAADGGPRAIDVGFVVMEVNGKPIYSDKVLGALERPLSAEAKKNDEKKFRELARQLLEQQVQLYARDELEVAAADLALEPADKQLAQAMTTQWRQQQITAAGGSEEVARRRAREDGWDFDELVQQQYRLKLVQLFYQKRIIPKIFVPPADQRAYYERNKATEFSQPSRLKFRVIRIDPATGFGSNTDAVSFASQVRERAKTEDFATLADEINKDGRGGAVGIPDSGGWVDANSYHSEKVEQAVSKLKPGEVTDVIDDGRMLYIAKLEAVQDPKVQAFDDPAVQAKIIQKLRNAQMQALREAHVKKLQRNAVTRENEGKLNDLLAIVMRKYPEWAKAG